MSEIEYVEPHSDYRCACPLPQTWEEELALATECAQREQEHEAAARRPDPGDDGAGREG